MFFVFDGVDGAGKSTQLNLFASWLRDRGLDVVCCSDPGTTQLGNQMRSLLLGNHEVAIHMRSEMLMFMTARCQLVEELIARRYPERITRKQHTRFQSTGALDDTLSMLSVKSTAGSLNK